MMAGRVWSKIRTRVIPGLPYLLNSRMGTCRACGHPTIFVCTGAGDEFRLCLRCRANRRYELLAQCLRQLDLPRLDVLELGFRSPLRKLLGSARSHTQSYYRPDAVPGSMRSDGAVCEDITRLSGPSASLDVIVSSDVLEHVCNIEAAFRESARVLRPGGVHLFTVPPRPATRQRAALENGTVRHLLPPEYHLDPLDADGILAFWDFGMDLPQRIDTAGLAMHIAAGPEGPDARIVWEARKGPMSDPAPQGG